MGADIVEHAQAHANATPNCRPAHLSQCSYMINSGILQTAQTFTVLYIDIYIVLLTA